MHVEVIGDQLSRNREFGECGRTTFRWYREWLSRERPVSRDDAYVCTCKGSRNNRDVFVRAPRIDDERADTAGYDYRVRS